MRARKTLLRDVRFALSLGEEEGGKRGEREEGRRTGCCARIFMQFYGSRGEIFQAAFVSCVKTKKRGELVKFFFFWQVVKGGDRLLG